MKGKVMIVDDDPNIVELIKLYVEKEGYRTKGFEGGNDALEAFDTSYDLVLLDIMMPEVDGYEVLREIRKISDIPVIMITAKGDTFDKVLGLELGADDYLVKPFDPKELMARIKAVIRRTKPDHQDEEVVRLENLVVDRRDYVVTYRGQKLELPPKELELLYHLARHPNRVFTREQLLDQIWGYDFIGESRTVDVHIKRLREKLGREDDPWEIKTVWGVGYKFRTD